jgi:hypothetical protein
MAGSRSISPGNAIVQIAVVAFVLVLLFAVISLDANAEQEAFNRGAMLLVVGDAVICIVPLTVRMARGRGAGSHGWNAWVAFVVLTVLSLVAYTVLGSLMLGRVL